MDCREHRAPAVLAPWVACPWQRESGGGPAVRVIPDACIDVVWTEGAGVAYVRDPFGTLVEPATPLPA